MIFSAFSILVLSALEPNHIKLRFLALAVSAADIPAGPLPIIIRSYILHSLLIMLTYKLVLIKGNGLYALSSALRP